MAKMKDKNAKLEMGYDEMMGDDIPGMDKFMDDEGACEIVRPSDPTSYVPIEENYNQSTMEHKGKVKAWKPKGRK